VVTAGEFCDKLKSQGFDFYTGVPCTTLKDVISHLLSDPETAYISATREDEAMGIATGAWLAGKRPVVLMQNSGVGSAINPLASLDILYRIPILLIVGWRGYEGKDAPEHLIMGEVTTKLLETIGVPVRIIDADDPGAAISHSARAMRETGAPAAAILKPGTIQ
jgi:sulfopyruvate decarboxylase subunit alpha